MTYEKNVAQQQTRKIIKTQGHLPDMIYLSNLFVAIYTLNRARGQRRLLVNAARLLVQQMILQEGFFF